MIALLVLALTAPFAVESKSRIVGGTEAGVNEFPWQVSLQSRQFSFFPWSHFCGGSLIAPDIVLTAAHCVDGSRASSIRVVVGLHRQSSTAGTQIVGVSRIITHPEYQNSGDGFPNDIAILKLSSSVSVGNGKAELVPLAQQDLSFLGNPDCWISGWGRTYADSGVSEVLMKAQMDVMNNGDCFSDWSQVTGADILDSHICIKAPGRSACSGDSGGPLVCRVDGEYVLAGVTSWGVTTCEGFPSVYVRVTHFLEWIDSNM